MPKEITDRAVSSSSCSNERTDLQLAAKEFGKRMRVCREKAGWDLVDLANHTKITIGIIESIESGDLKVLPGSVFGRGFIKNICRAIDQDSGELLKEFDRIWDLLHQTHNVVNPQENNVVSVSDHAEISDCQPHLTESKDFRKFWLATLALIVCATVYSYVSKISGFVKVPNAEQTKQDTAMIEPKSIPESDNPEKAAELDGQLGVDPAVNTSESASSTTAESEIGKDHGDSAKGQVDSGPSLVVAGGEVATVTENATEEANQKPPLEDGKSSTSGAMEVSVVVTKEVKIKAKIDDKREDILNLAPGSYHYTFEQFAEMLIMDASAVQVSFNGKSLGVLGSPGRVRRISFAKDQEQLKRVF